jgi:hypothetical protein
MKILDVPADVTPKPIAGRTDEPKPISFREWLTLHLDTYGGIKTPSQVRQAGKIVGAIEAGNGTMSFEDADFDVLKASLQENKYVPGIARQLTSFYDAVDKAQEVKK